MSQSFCRGAGGAGKGDPTHQARPAGLECPGGWAGTSVLWRLLMCWGQLLGASSVSTFSSWTLSPLTLSSDL